MKRGEATPQFVNSSDAPATSVIRRSRHLSRWCDHELNAKHEHMHACMLACLVAADLIRPIDYAAAPQSYPPHWSDAPASRLSDAETNGATCLTKEGGCDRFWKRQCGQRQCGRTCARTRSTSFKNSISEATARTCPARLRKRQCGRARLQKRQCADVLAFGSDSADVLAF